MNYQYHEITILTLAQFSGKVVSHYNMMHYHAGLIITLGHRSFDHHKEPCGRSNSIVSGHSDRPYWLSYRHMHFSTGSGQWLVVTNVMIL